MTDADLQARLDFALEASREAADFILRYYQCGDLAVELKGDLSPVTVADRGAEELLRRRIGERFPGDGVLGEEHGETPSESGYRWVVDPIDGTKAFVAGVPLFGTLVGIERGGVPLAGVVRMPALDEVMYARRGGGAWWQMGDEEPRPARVTAVDSLDQALFCFTEMAGWYAIGRPDLFDSLSRTVRGARGWGDCYGHMLVATGRADFAIDPLMSAWDIAALIPIVEEAGGFCGDWTGRVTITGGNGVSTNAALKDTVLELLG
jgi:myo-inositol-1(or 4)-monophosphatase